MYGAVDDGDRSFDLAAPPAPGRRPVVPYATSKSVYDGLERGLSKFFGNNNDDRPDHHRDGKVIGSFASAAIFINAIIGPGLLSLPKVFKDAGLVLTGTLLIAGFILAAFATMARSETVALMPDNADFTRTVEFADPALNFVGRRTFYLSHIFFYLASMSMAIASIVLVAEASDIVIARIFGRTWALTLNGGHTAFNVAVWSLDNCDTQDLCRPFETGDQVSTTAFVSLGYVATFLVIFPVSTDRISEGMALQWVSFAVAVIAVPLASLKAAHSVFLVHGIRSSHLTLIATGKRTLSASGVVLFNLMYGIFVSTWLGEKRRDVSVSSVVYGTSFYSCLAMIAYGASLAAASRHVSSDGLLESTERGEPVIEVVLALLFGFFVIASGIPVACIMARHNLRASTLKLVDDACANILCVWLPWGVAWLFYPSRAYRALVNYAGLFVVAWLALWLPFFILLHAIKPIADDATTSDYLAWFLDHFLAPPDYYGAEISVLPLLPDALRPYARRIYASMLVVIAGWLVGALFSYLIYIVYFLIREVDGVS